MLCYAFVGVGLGPLVFGRSKQRPYLRPRLVIAQQLLCKCTSDFVISGRVSDNRLTGYYSRVVQRLMFRLTPTAPAKPSSLTPRIDGCSAYRLSGYSNGFRPFSSR